MKKIGKLSINPEKVMKNEELLNLKGGYGGDCGYGPILECVANGSIIGQFCVPDCQDGLEICQRVWPETDSTICW